MAVQKAGQRCANNTWPPWANLVFENVALVSLTQKQCTQALVMKTQMCDKIRPKDVAEIMPFPGRKLGENISMVQPSPAAVGFDGTLATSQSLSTPGEPRPSLSTSWSQRTFSCAIQKTKCQFLFLCFQKHQI